MSAGAQPSHLWEELRGFALARGGLPPLTAGVPSQTARLRIRKSPTGLAALNTRCSHGRESASEVLLNESLYPDQVEMLLLEISV